MRWTDRGGTARATAAAPLEIRWNPRRHAARGKNAYAYLDRNERVHDARQPGRQLLVEATDGLGFHRGVAHQHFGKRAALLPGVREREHRGSTQIRHVFQRRRECRSLLYSLPHAREFA